MKEILDHLFASAHFCFKNQSKTFRNNFAFYYMLLFQLLFLLLLGLFFNAFSKQLNINTLIIPAIRALTEKLRTLLPNKIHDLTAPALMAS